MQKITMHRRKVLHHNYRQFWLDNLPPFKTLALHVDGFEHWFAGPESQVLEDVRSTYGICLQNAPSISFLTVHAFADEPVLVEAFSQDADLFNIPEYRQNEHALWELYLWDCSEILIIQ